jgi:signal transduction histidine kinase
MLGVPDAFAQLLDKLVENAVDFAPPGTPIRISLERAGLRATLAVENQGPALPQSMADGIFESMVSLRPGPSGSGAAHLGLGLYIVRLVAKFHGARVRAKNLSAAGGARFEVEVLLP